MHHMLDGWSGQKAVVPLSHRRRRSHLRLFCDLNLQVGKKFRVESDADRKNVGLVVTVTYEEKEGEEER